MSKFGKPVRKVGRFDGVKVKFGASGRILGTVLSNTVNVGKPIIAACCSLDKIVLIVAR